MSLPPLYAAWMDELLAQPIPEETEATCDDCAMCSVDDTPAGARVSFDPTTKCCTFVPLLPNFLVGRILREDHPDGAPGRASVEARIAAGIAVTPLGLGRTPTYDLLYRHSPASFGRVAALRCPHYLPESGHCAIWRHRNSTCVSWFCKLDRGAVGLAFWGALKDLLRAAEVALARHCLLELDLGIETLERLRPEPRGPTTSECPLLDADELTGVTPAGTARQLWGSWLGREAEFYRLCADRTDALRWADVRAIGGAELRLHERLVRDAFRKLCSEDLPPRLHSGSFELLQIRSGTVRVQSYSEFDPLELSQELLDLLGRFDGRSTDEVLAALREEGTELEPALVRRLVDFRILVAEE